MPCRAAFDLATATEQVVTYLGLQVPFPAEAAALERLWAYPQVVEASVAVQRVPTGAPIGSGIDLFGLSPREKIARGLGSLGEGVEREKGHGF